MQTHTPAPLPPQPVRVQAKLTVSTAHDVHEQEAGRVAEQVSRLPASSGTSAPPPITPLSPGTTGNPSGGLVVPSGVAAQLGQGGGQPLAEPVRRRMERAFGHDFGQVRIYADDASADLSHQVRAKAFTHGHDIYFGRGHYQPHSSTGQHLLAHELTHVVQQQGVSNPPIARSREDWLTSTPDVSLLPLSQILLDMDEIQQWIAEQISSSPELDRLNEALLELRAEAMRRDARTRPPAPRPRRRRRRQPAEAAPPLPAQRPLILDARSSIEYADSDEMRQQFDLIMEWLAHPSLSTADRGILEIERGRLAPDFQQMRLEVAQERQARRVQTALVSSDQEGPQLLETLASRIQAISPDPNDPRVAFIYDQNGRVAISVEQAEQLRQTLTRQLRSATRNFRDQTSGYLEQYRFRLEMNIDQPVVSGISGILGGAEFADRAFWRGYTTIMQETLRADELLQNGQFVEVARLLNTLTQPFEHIRTTVNNFDAAYESGAQRAVSGLTFIRDAAFAIDTALLTIIAAPFVAGAVATTGVTGVAGTVLTVGGTGVLVGSGMAVIRGGSGALGVALAGGSWADVTQAGWDEAKRGFREGFISGASGGAARLLGPAMGVGGEVGQQVLRRVGAEGTVNGLATMFDVLWQGGSLEDAVAAGARSAVLSAPGAVVGGSQSDLIREVGGPLTAAATVFIDAAARGVPPGEAMQAAAMAVVVNVGTTQATTRQRPATPTEQPTPSRPTTPDSVAAPDTVPIPAPDNVIDLAAARARLRPTSRPNAPQSQTAEAALPIPLQQAANDQLPQSLPLAAGAEGQVFQPMASAGGGSRRPPTLPTQAPLQSPSDYRPRTTGVDSLPDGPPRTSRRQDEPDLVDILESRQPSTARRDVDTPDTDDGATILPFSSRPTTDGDGLAVGTARQSGVGLAESHHIGSRYQQRIRAVFDAVGLDIEGPANRLLSEEHGQQRGWYQRDRQGRFQHQERGHHPNYHRWVLANLQRARGRGLPVEQSRARVEQMLERLGRIVDSNPEVLQYGDAIFTNRPDMLRPPLN